MSLHADFCFLAETLDVPGKGLGTDKRCGFARPLPFHLGFVPGSMIEREAERRNSQKRGVGIPRAALQRQVGACDNFLVRPGKLLQMGLQGG